MFYSKFNIQQTQNKIVRTHFRGTNFEFQNTVFLLFQLYGEEVIVSFGDIVTATSLMSHNIVF